MSDPAPVSAGQIDCAAFFVGPYRNLTTITASVLALHPQVQVLNHAGERLMADPALDVLGDPRPEVLDRFVAAGLEASASGQQGQYGGSILLSHAFGEPLQEAYRARFGEARLKTGARAFVWKDSMVLQRALMKDPNGAGRLLDTLPKVKLLAPFRHPLDVAFSSVRTGHWRILTTLPDPDLWATLDAVLEAFRWMLEQRDRYPERVLLYTQWDVGEPLLRRLAGFLGVEADARWLADAGRCFEVRRRYIHPPAHLDRYDAQVREKLGPWPELVALATAR